MQPLQKKSLNEHTTFLFWSHDLAQDCVHMKNFPSYAAVAALSTYASGRPLQVSFPNSKDCVLDRYSEDLGLFSA